MQRDKRKVEYMAELESQFIMRLPEEPAKTLRELLKSGDNIKNRLTIQIDNDMRHGEVRFDHWVMHAKIVDLPTITESLKTIDNKSFYKTADVCQMMICKEEPDQTPTEEEAPAKSKKKDPYKVDKKFLFPHGVTPPTKNVRKRRFRKTLKKKYVEAPEIEKEVKRLLRADNEAESSTYEVIQEDDDQHVKAESIVPVPLKQERKTKAERASKKETITSTRSSTSQEPSNVVDIFGGAVSDSDVEDDTDNVNVGVEDSRFSGYDSRLSDNSSILGLDMHRRDTYPIEFDSQMFRGHSSKKGIRSRATTPATSTITRSGGLSSEEDVDYHSQDNMSEDNMSLRVEQLRTELEELKLRRQRTQHEIAGMENLALRQRFQEILHTLNQDVMFKEMEYQGLITLQNSEDI